jgi:hypothetical protein
LAWLDDSSLHFASLRFYIWHLSVQNIFPLNKNKVQIKNGERFSVSNNPFSMHLVTTATNANTLSRGVPGCTSTATESTRTFCLGRLLGLLYRDATRTIAETSPGSVELACHNQPFSMYTRRIHNKKPLSSDQCRHHTILALHLPTSH